MPMTTRVHNLLTKPYVAMIAIFWFIAIDEMGNNSIIDAIASNSSFPHLPIIIIFLTLQFIAAPIQAGRSDYRCRKNSITFSLLITLASLSLFILQPYLSTWSLYIAIYTATLLKAVFGNTLPMSWAAMADTKQPDFRFSIGFATTGMAGGYLFLSLLSQIPLNLSTLQWTWITVAIGILISSFAFIDRRDRKGCEKPIKKELHEIYTDFILCKRFRRALAAFIFWEWSFYTIFVLDVDMHIELFKYFSITMIAGWVAGILILKFAKTSDQTMIKIGYYLSVLSLALLTINVLASFTPKYFQLIFIFFYSIGCAFLVPSLFSILTKERGESEQGKIYGLIDSADTISFALAIALGIIYLDHTMTPTFIYTLSLSILIISIYYYRLFKRSKMIKSHHDH